MELLVSHFFLRPGSHLLRYRTTISCLVFLLTICAAFIPYVNAEDDAVEELQTIIPLGVIDPDLVQYGYSASEKLAFDVSWSGGVKIGELNLEIVRLEDEEDSFEIRAAISTKGGAVHLFYPISDRHVTKVRGKAKLPYHYEVWQKEGYSYKAHRITEYDQDKFKIRYSKNDKLEKEYQLDGVVNNEFSSFFNSRLMDFSADEPFVVPTFADKKRVEVAVHPKGTRIIKGTILGDVKAREIMPVMKFKGLYDKRGDTVIWYSDDKCRVPVKIKSKIAIGSLTARLTAYENSSCDIYPKSGRKEVTEKEIKGDK
jgi:hypothetical protein